MESLVDIYAASRARLVELAAGLDERAASAPVVPTPLWDVTDVYRHLAGRAADVVAGRLEGAGTPDWTAAQVKAFRGVELPEICAAWAEGAAEFEARLAALGPMGLRVAGDVWTHEQDIRGAVGLPGLREDPAAPVLARGYADLVTERWALFPDAPPVEIVVDGDALRFGPGDPELTLTTTSYEFLRAVVGRRSQAQLAAAAWSGPAPERVFTVLSRFELPVSDVPD